MSQLQHSSPTTTAGNASLMCVRLNVHRGTAYGLLFTSCVNETSAILENLFMRFPVSCHVMQYLTAVQQLHRKHQDGDLSRDSRMWMRRKTKRSNQINARASFWFWSDDHWSSFWVAVHAPSGCGRNFAQTRMFFVGTMVTTG